MIGIVHARNLIKSHGHLVMDGTETKKDLIEALIYLRQHTYMRCHRPYLGTPIDSLIPDIHVLMESSTRRPRRVISVDMSGERL